MGSDFQYLFLRYENQKSNSDPTYNHFGNGKIAFLEIKSKSRILNFNFSWILFPQMTQFDFVFKKRESNLDLEPAKLEHENLVGLIV